MVLQPSPYMADAYMSINVNDAVVPGLLSVMIVHLQLDGGCTLPGLRRIPWSSPSAETTMCCQAYASINLDAMNRGQKSCYSDFIEVDWVGGSRLYME